MKSSRIGIRALREGLSSAIDRVRNGQVLEITEIHNKAGALVPVERSLVMLGSIDIVGSRWRASSRSAAREDRSSISSPWARCAHLVARGDFLDRSSFRRG